MRRWLLVGLGVIVLAVVAYWLLIRDTAVEPSVEAPRAVATIGSGPEAVAVGSRGQLLPWLPVSEGVELPLLPLSEPPQSGRLAGPVLAQAKVLGAAPAALRPYLERSSYGETGVDVTLRSGVELRFGAASQVAAKWKAAAALLADPALTTLDYVNLAVPGRASVGGSGHTLPPPE